jgi:acyl carrier protein
MPADLPGAIDEFVIPRHEEAKMKTIDKLIAIIRNNKETEVLITEHTDLRKELALDSFDVLMIMNEIDDTYAISLEEDDFKRVNTPGEIAALLQQKYGINEL